MADDARAVGGLQGGAGTSRAFAEFMKAAPQAPGRTVRNQRPDARLATDPDEEAWGMN
jgi:hypothetical protein